MILDKHISEWAVRIAGAFRPERIILFGSTAYGEPKNGSDVDLLVVMPHAGSAIQKAAEIRLALPSDVAVDVLVRTPAQIRARLRMNDYFIRDVMTKGRVLYEAGDARMDAD